MIKPLCIASFVVLVTGCASISPTQSTYEHYAKVMNEVLTDPENRAIVALGCTYEQTQKALNGVPQDAPYEDLRNAWGTNTVEQLMQMHGLSASSTWTDLYRAVRIQLERDHVCEKTFKI